MKTLNVADHTAWIAQIARKYWLSLPASVKDSVDPDDLVQDAIVHVLRKKHLFSAEKSAPTTWLHRVVSNYLKDRLIHYRQSRRCAVTVSCEDLQIPVYSSQVRIRAAEVAVESFLRSADYDLVVVLADGFFRRKPYNLRPEHLERLRTLVSEAQKRSRVTVEDFLLVSAATVNV